MNIKGLQAFSLVMSRGTLAEAAVAMNLGQSSVSRQISILENELGVKLFNRERRRLTPTEEGEAFFREAQRILTGLQEIPHIIDTIKTGRQRNLRLVTMPRLATSLVAPAVFRLMEQDPSIHVSIDVQSLRFLERWVARFQYDLGIGSLPALHAAIRTETICHLPAVAVVHPDNPLAQRESLTAQDLASQPLIALFPGTLLRHHLESVFADEGIHPSIRLEVSTGILACSMVAEGFGVTIMDPFVPMAVGEGRVVAIPIAPRIDLAFGFLYPRGGTISPVIEEFVRITRTVAKEFILDHGYDRWMGTN